MASGYTSSTSLSATGIATFSGETHSKTGSFSGDSDIVDETQDIGTSSEQITLGELGTSVALLEIKNLDSTNFVSVGFANPVVAGTNTFKILAGQSILVTGPSANLYAIADTATVKILKKAVETT